MKDVGGFDQKRNGGIVKVVRFEVCFEIRVNRFCCQIRCGLWEKKKMSQGLFKFFNLAD